jgi:hypothetical protein
MWILAIGIWSQTPLPPNWFASSPSPPNFETYPNSDAALYDITGISATLGEGFSTSGGAFALRPLYAFFLAILHTFVGLNYEPAISIQVIILAIFPAIVFFLTKRLHNHFSGIIAALLIIVREGNAINLADQITVSNSKLFMSGVPTAVGTALFILIVLIWFKKPSNKRYVIVASGGLLGALMLVRAEVGIFFVGLGFVFFLAIYQYFKTPIDEVDASQQHLNHDSIPSADKKSARMLWFKSMVLLLSGILLMISPWIWRNWKLTGKIYFDYPNYRVDLIEQRYKPPPIKASPAPKPDSKLNKPTAHITDGSNRIGEKNTDSIGYFILNHFLNSHSQLVLIFPSTFRIFDSSVNFLGHQDINLFWEQCCTSRDYVRRLPFWHDWDGELPKQSIIPLSITLFILSIGISQSWKKNQHAAVIPLTLGFGYILIHALVRNSGGRYLLPVDWISILYYSIGLAQLLTWIRFRLKGKDFGESKMSGENLTGYDTEIIASGKQRKFSVNKIAASGLIIMILGSIIPIYENATLAPSLNNIRQERLSAFLVNNELTFTNPEIEAIKEFINDGGAIATGKAIYPRFHKANKGEPGVRWTPFLTKPYPRVSFILIGDIHKGVIMPLQQSPERLDNGSDVLVIGCEGKVLFEPVAIALFDESGKMISALRRDGYPNHLSCPFIPPEN